VRQDHIGRPAELQAGVTGVLLCGKASVGRSRGAASRPAGAAALLLREYRVEDESIGGIWLGIWRIFSRSAYLILELNYATTKYITILPMWPFHTH
jgi:hypothetical protein